MESGSQKHGNITLEKDCALLSVQTSIFALDVIYASSYSFLDRAYVFLSGDPAKNVIVELRSKGKDDLLLLAREFNNELINYAAYNLQSEKTSALRDQIAAKAIVSCTECMEDPLGIAKPWEDSHES